MNGKITTTTTLQQIRSKTFRLHRYIQTCSLGHVARNYFICSVCEGFTWKHVRSCELAGRDVAASGVLWLAAQNVGELVRVRTCFESQCRLVLRHYHFDFFLVYLVMRFWGRKSVGNCKNQFENLAGWIFQKSSIVSVILPFRTSTVHSVQCAYIIYVAWCSRYFSLLTLNIRGVCRLILMIYTSLDRTLQ